jgi:rubrerythrin
VKNFIRRTLDFTTEPFGSSKPQGNLSVTDIRGFLIQDLMAELDAIQLYEAHLEVIGDSVIKDNLQEIANDEKEHVGQFLMMLQEYDPDFSVHMIEGFEEYEEVLNKITPRPAEFPPEENPHPSPPIETEQIPSQEIEQGI